MKEPVLGMERHTCSTYLLVFDKKIVSPRNFVYISIYNNHDILSLFSESCPGRRCVVFVAGEAGGVVGAYLSVMREGGPLPHMHMHHM